MKDEIFYFKLQKRELGNQDVKLTCDDKIGNKFPLLSDYVYSKDFISEITKLTNNYIDENILRLEKEINSLFK